MDVTKPYEFIWFGGDPSHGAQGSSVRVYPFCAISLHCSLTELPDLGIQLGRSVGPCRRYGFLSFFDPGPGGVQGAPGGPQSYPWA